MIQYPSTVRIRAFIMFIAKIKSGKNTYVRLMESYRNEDGKPCSRMVKNFGRYEDLIKDNPNAFEELKAKYKQDKETKYQLTQTERYREVERILSLKVPDSSGSDDISESPSLSYGHYVLKRLWEEDLQLDRKISYLQKSKTQFRFDLNAAVSYMCFSKILEPVSILYGFDDKDNFLGDPAKDLELHDFYNSLDFLNDNKDELFSWINNKIDTKYGKNRATMVFYDVTNAYFETDLTDMERGYDQKDFAENLQSMAFDALDHGELPENCFDEDGNIVAENLTPEFLEKVADSKMQYLRMRGPSKEHRFDLPIVSMALIIDSNGFPMDFAVYPGNASEFRTMRQSIEAFKQKYDIKDVIVSDDRGINSTENLKMLKDAGFGFLVAQKVTQFDADLTAKLLDRQLYTPLDADNPEQGGYQVIKDWKKGKGSKTVSCTLVLTYNEKRRLRDEAVLKVMRKIVENKISKGEKLGPRKTGWAEFADIGERQEKKIIGINEDVYKKKLSMCGFAGLVYYAPDGLKDKLTPADMTMSYKRQSRIEECFRIMKNNLGLRPMYVRNSDHIRGHITVCTLALLLIRLLQQKLSERHINFSIDEICKTLNQAVVGAIKTEIDGKEDALFLPTARKRSLRKRRESLKTEEILKLVREGQFKRKSINDLLTSVGLEPLPKIGKRQDIAHCLKTYFPKLEDAVSPLAFC